MTCCGHCSRAARSAIGYRLPRAQLPVQRERTAKRIELQAVGVIDLNSTLRCDDAAQLPLMLSLIIPLIIACALFMEQMDSTVISTSLPVLAVDMGVDPISLKLALTSYLVLPCCFQ